MILWPVECFEQLPAFGYNVLMMPPTGESQVVGATNRIDAIDPALRRPGRFDRELAFSLPSREARRSILKIHTTKWPQIPSEEFLGIMASRTAGYCACGHKLHMLGRSMSTYLTQP